MASKEANKLKYQYNKKYMDAYWERKAAKINIEQGGCKVSITLPKATDFVEKDKYISALEETNQLLKNELDRITKEIDLIKQSIQKI